MSQTYYQAPSPTDTPTPPVIPTPPVAPPPLPPKPPVEPLSSGKKLQALLLLIAAILWVDFALFGGFELGHTIMTWIVTALYLVFAGRGRFTVYSVSCICLAAASTLVFALYNDGMILFCLFNLYFILMAAAVCDRFRIGRHSTGSFRNVGDMIVLTIAYPFMACGRALKALFIRKHKGTIRNKGVLTGILCAIPVIAIVLPLLISADAAFANMFNFLKDINLFRVFFAVIFGCILFFFVYSHAYGARYRVYAHEPSQRTQRNVLPTAALLSFSCAISLIYVLYIISQLTYFFSAFVGETHGAFFPADYARRGFFEMCIICVINLALMFGVLGLSGRYQGKIQRPIAGICTFISAFSLLLIATAQSKMYLYISRFGLTRLRLLSSVFTVFLAVVFIVLILRLFITRLPYMRLVVLTGAVLCIAIGLADVDASIAHYNVDAYQSGKLSTIDLYALDNLNESAVPHLMKLLDDKDPAVQKRAEEILNEQYLELKRNYQNGIDFREFDISEYRAYRLLKEKFNS